MIKWFLDNSIISPFFFAVNSFCTDFRQLFLYTQYIYNLRYFYGIKTKPPNPQRGLKVRIDRVSCARSPASALNRASARLVQLKSRCAWFEASAPPFAETLPRVFSSPCLFCLAPRGSLSARLVFGACLWAGASRWSLSPLQFNQSP